MLLHNDGGGIFHFLPVSGEGEDFVEHVATPHGLDFAHAAALFGCGYEVAEDVEAFRAALGRALAADAHEHRRRPHRPRGQRRPAPRGLGRGRRLGPMSPRVIAVDVGGTDIKAALVDGDASELAARSLPTPGTPGRHRRRDRRARR